MPTIRTFSDGTKLAIPDMKITRRLDAITKYLQNNIVSGCDYAFANNDSTLVGNEVHFTPGEIIMNNSRKIVASIIANVGTYATHKYATIYIPSTGFATIIPTVAHMASRIGNWCPDGTASGTDFVPDAAMLLAHVYRTAASPTKVNLIDVNTAVRPVLYYGIQEWHKDNNSDTDTSHV